MISRTQFQQEILPVVLKFEGGYSNMPGDKGGETYRGISRLKNPDWAGWKAIDKFKKPNILSKTKIIPQNTIFPELELLVVNFYFDNYFVKNGFHLLSNPKTALTLFDWAVHGGYSLSKVKEVMQQAFGKKINETTFNNKVAAVLDSVDQNRLNAALIDKRKGRLNQIVQANPDQAKFMPGWNNRIDTLKNLTVSQKAGIGATGLFLAGFAAYLIFGRKRTRGDKK